MESWETRKYYMKEVIGLLIKTNYYGHDLPKPFGDAAIEVSEGSTVKAAMETCFGLLGMKLSFEDFIENTSVLLNGNLAPLDTILQEGDRLLFLRTLAGG